MILNGWAGVALAWHAVQVDARTQDGRAALAFARFTDRIHDALPSPLQRIPGTFIGYAIINSTAFGIDMLFLSMFHGWGRITYPVAVTMGYALACVFAFVVNRRLNFRSHGHMGTESAKYSFVVASNYVIWILGFSTLMESMGVQYQMARFTAACIEGLYIYVLLRWWVFPRERALAPVVPVAGAVPVAGVVPVGGLAPMREVLADESAA